MEKKKRHIGITDTTLRDAHQSLWATRMRLTDILPIAERIDDVGYHSVEVWGGATFDVCMRYLNEDPWERLHRIREKFKRTKLQMLLRGQNLVAYRNFADDLVEEFIKHAVAGGIDIIRIFDALNDIRNMQKSIEVTKREGAHAQGTICYTVSPVHDIESYVALAKELVELGSDSICIKDMSGILAPYVAYDLVKRLKEAVEVPIQLHSHASTGMATTSYLKALEAGADVVDCAAAPLSLYTSQPAIETLVASLKETEYDLGLDFDAIRDVSEYFEVVSKNRKLMGAEQPLIDITVISHQIPGGMATNLIAQLEQQNALDRLEEVLEEIPIVRRDMGYPPLVTPTSQLVGTQAVFNVLLGERYKIIPREIENYVKGYYGRPAGPIGEELKRKALKGEEPITCRPADLLEPELPRAKQELDPSLVEKEEDYISYAIFPDIALKFFEWRKNPVISEEEPPQRQMERREKALLDGASLEELSERLAVVVSEGVAQALQGLSVTISLGGQAAGVEAAAVPATRRSAVAQMEKEDLGLVLVRAPMVGTFYRTPSPGAPPYVEEGDEVKEGQTLCLIEVMKLFNEIPSPVNGRVKRILAEHAKGVEYDEVIMEIEPLGG
ncbi:MAG: pyruvate/oxaloacetate carboxyltransferase [Actinobacteria bacterium]|nr:pyruvate/oxaloacetate carboxyltransferase [Actinomycetota bacterium]